MTIEEFKIYSGKNSINYINFFPNIFGTKNLQVLLNRLINFVRVNQEYCTDDYFEFNFSGSTSAYNFINKFILTNCKKILSKPITPKLLIELAQNINNK